LIEELDLAKLDKLSETDMRREVMALVADFARAERMALNTADLNELGMSIVDEMVGLGPLEPLLKDESINDILINGPFQVYVERRGELGLLAAVGFRRRELQGLVLSEHGVLLGLGLGLGIIAAAVAVLPAILSPAAQLPYGSLALTLGAVCANGLLWTWVATRYALRGNLLAALRNE